MMHYNCLIVDDEPVAQSIIERYIDQVPWLHLVSKCKNALEASDWLTREQVDLIFLDIEMPHLDGINFLSSLTEPPKVILTTAYREYALEGFELNVVDYLLKPISLERFLKAIHKLAPGKSRNGEVEDYIYIKSDKKMVQVYLNDIYYVEGLSNYVKIFTATKTIISYQKLSYLESVLPRLDFFRCHRSYIVAKRHIKSYNPNYLDIDDNEIPIGGSYKAKVLDFLKPFET